MSLQTGLQLEVTRLALRQHPLDTALISDLQINVPPAIVHTVMGASGSGKSSLLAAVCGTLAPVFTFEGAVSLNGQRIDAMSTEQRRVGILFQDDLLFAVSAGPKAQREAQVKQALDDLELPGFAHADPATLSGGQRARIALMRALLAQPHALLLDEPFSRLDAALRGRMREFVFATVRTRQIPVLLVTHDEADVADAGHLSRL